MTRYDVWQIKSDVNMVCVAGAYPLATFLAYLVAFPQVAFLAAFLATSFPQATFLVNLAFAQVADLASQAFLGLAIAFEVAIEVESLS